MREFNLAGRNPDVKPKAAITLDAEKMKIDFHVVVPQTLKEAVHHLGKDAEVDAIQRELDRVFTDERRERMLDTASKTAAGLPAVYYRYVPARVLNSLLERGAHIPQDNIAPGKRVAELATVEAYLTDYLGEILAQKGVQGASLKKQWKGMDLEEKFHLLFPRAPKSRVKTVVEGRDYADIQAFFDDYVENSMKRLAHKSGWPGLELSNLLSASAGAPIVETMGHLHETVAYLEFIAPDDQVRTHADGTLGETDEEKEVFVKKIPLEWVTRVYVDRARLLEETVDHPGSAVSAWAKEHPLPEEKKVSAYKNWHRNAKTNDMLPASFSRRRAKS